MKKSPLKLFLISTTFYLVNFSQSFAGSGYYLGADYIKNLSEINTNTIVGAVSVNKIEKNKSDDYGFRLGYKHPISKYLYIAPEFFYNSINKSGYLYSTSMKAGVEIKNLSLFGSFGYAEIKEFDGSSENFGGGLEYKINDNFSISSEYTKFNDVMTSETDSFATTNKRSKLQSFKFGLTYYFHE